MILKCLPLWVGWHPAQDGHYHLGKFFTGPIFVKNYSFPSSFFTFCEKHAISRDAETKVNSHHYTIVCFSMIIAFACLFASFSVASFESTIVTCITKDSACMWVCTDFISNTQWYAWCLNSVKRWFNIYYKNCFFNFWTFWFYISWPLFKNWHIFMCEQMHVACFLHFSDRHSPMYSYPLRPAST